MNITQAVAICEQYRIDNSINGFLLEALEAMQVAKQFDELTVDQCQALQTIMREGLRLVGKGEE
jgi:hypothetical protein